MKRASRYLLAIAVLLVFLLLVVPAQGSGCRVVAVRQNHHVVKQAVVVEKVVAAAVVTPIVAQFVPVPLYGATYSPYAFPPPVQQAPLHHHPQAAPCADVAGAVAELKAQIAALKAQLNYQPTPRAPDPFNPPQAQQQKQQQADDPISRILSARCAACHDDSRAKAAGKGIVLTQGGKAKAFSPEELGAVIASVATKQMPKGVPMPDAERIELIAALTGGGK
jgi:hypothetical protein